MKRCIGPECDRKANGRFCPQHRRQSKAGIVLTPVARRSEGAVIFWEKVNKDGRAVRPELGPCWEWTGMVLRSGYGMLTREYRQILVHRYSWVLANGPIPEGDGHHGVCVCHRCDNRLCVNPGHLFLGTHADNMRDAAAKGRFVLRVGESNPVSRMTEQDVRKIRSLVASGETLRATARQCGCSPGNVSWIVSRKTWRHVA